MNVRRFLVGAAATGLMLVVAAGPAGADVDGPCTATIDGRDVAGRSGTDPGDAIEVDADATIVVAATSEGELTSYEIEMTFAGFSWTVATGEASGTSWQRTVDIGDYARFGVGLYQVSGVSKGEVTCTGTALVRITGRSPLITVAGGVATALVLASIAGLAALVLRLLGGSSSPALQAFLDRYPVPAEPSARLDWARAAAGQAGSPADVVTALEHLGRNGASWGESEPLRSALLRLGGQPLPMAGLLGPIGALVLMSGAGAWAAPTGGSPTGSSPTGGSPVSGVHAQHPQQHLPRLRFRPRFPAVGILSGIAGGLGLLVLLQQAGKVFPTRLQLILFPVAGIVVALLLANVAHGWALRDLNRRLGALDATLAATSGFAPTHGVPAPGLDAHAQPVADQPPTAHLEAGLPVEVVERWGDWALVRCANGWTGWVDGRGLAPLVTGNLGAGSPQ